MKKIFFAIVVIMMVAVLFSASTCNKTTVNPNVPIVSIDISIDPNSTLFYDLNIVGGWTYMRGKPGVYIPPGSRGVIVYRVEMNRFLAYERTPPNEPAKCCDDITKTCTALVIGDYYPFVVDTCTDNQYNILDGSLFKGVGGFPLIQYRCDYDGAILHIYN
jgi:hypothetical protein